MHKRNTAQNQWKPPKSKTPKPSGYVPAKCNWETNADRCESVKYLPPSFIALHTAKYSAFMHELHLKEFQFQISRSTVQRRRSCSSVIYETRDVGGGQRQERSCKPSVNRSTLSFFYGSVSLWKGRTKFPRSWTGFTEWFRSAPHSPGWQSLSQSHNTSICQ